MKQTIQTLTRFILLTALCALPSTAQQFGPVAVTTIPPVIWTGTNAQAIVRQLLAITNANGSAVVPGPADEPDQHDQHHDPKQHERRTEPSGDDPLSRPR